MGFDGQGSWNGIFFDTVLNEEHSTKASVTKHPVENGAKPADHIQTENETSSLEVGFSNVPLSSDDLTTRGPPDKGGGYARAQVEELVRAALAKELGTLKTPTRTMPNMALLSVSRVIDNRRTDVMVVTLTFEQVRVVSTDQVRLSAQLKPTKIPNKPTGTINEGVKQSTEITDPAQKDQLRSGYRTLHLTAARLLGGG